MAESALPPSAEIMERFMAGESLASIGRQYGRSRATVSSRLAKDGYDPIRSRNLVPIDSYRASEEYRSGLSIRACARNQGVSEARMRKALVEAGVEIREPNDQQMRGRHDADAIVAMYKDGKGISSIARAFEANPHTIRRILVRSGVYTPSRDKRNRIDPEREQRIIDLLLAGEPKTRVAFIEQVCRETVDRVIIRNGLVRREDGTWCLPEDKGG